MRISDWSSDVCSSDLLQHALPVTFGYKAAVWLAGVERHRQRLSELRPRALTGQFAGAAGTLASLGEDGFAVQEALMDELGLDRPAVTWHVARDVLDRQSTRLNSSHSCAYRMPSSA